MNIAELRRLEAEATTGEWVVSDDYEYRIVLKDQPYEAIIEAISCNDGTGGVIAKDEDLALIVAMRNALPELLKALEESQAENASLRRVNKALGNMLEPHGGVDV